MHVGEWWYSLDHDKPCRVVAVEELWGQTTCLVWQPDSGAVVRVAGQHLVPMGQEPERSNHHVTYVCAAALIADALARDALVAPLEAGVIPLPHQLHALQRAMAADGVRFLLADEVGLGKTIEAGLIFRELKVRGLVKRVLVVAPAGLVTQWVSEMKTHFHEDFHLVMPGTFSAWRQIAALGDDDNLWRMHDQVVCPLDSVKPVEGRRGWSREQLARHNRERFDDLLSAGWDLVIMDEAHRLGGSTEQVARFKLADGLAQSVPYLLLLTATPHQGKTDSFRRLIGFLDPKALPDPNTVRREDVAPYVIRTEKRRTIDSNGNPLFKPRRTQLVPVAWDERRSGQAALYEAVTEYVREGYNQALREKHTAIGFLMILMQRLVTSSTAAIRCALERRLEVLNKPDGQFWLFPEEVPEALTDADSQEQMETLLITRLRGLKNERAEVELLLSAARRCEAHGPDVKTEALLERIQKLQAEENDPALKVLVFTEFVATQTMLATYLGDRGFSVVVINGSMGLDERSAAQRAFAGDCQVLVSTDAGGEGINLQFCHVVINYDLPWNPMKLEQRIGRVDRIGQNHVVRALNFALDGTVELRVREVLEEKLQKILEEFGVDKLSDVLDCEEGEVRFDDLYIQAVLSPDQAEMRATALAEEVRRRASAAAEGNKLLEPAEPLTPEAAKRIAEHQMPFWTERMALAYLRSQESHGARVDREEARYNLRWPDGTTIRGAVFSREDAQRLAGVHVTIEDERVRTLVESIPVFAPGQPVCRTVILGVSDLTSGLWSLWRVGLETPSGSEGRYVAVYVDDDGRQLQPTARLVWDRLIESDGNVNFLPDRATGERAVAAFDASRKAAEELGAGVYAELLEAHRERLEREKERASLSFAARRRGLSRIGLAAVRAHRMALLKAEEDASAVVLKAREHVVPELSAVVVLRVARRDEVQP